MFNKKYIFVLEAINVTQMYCSPPILITFSVGKTRGPMGLRYETVEIKFSLQYATFLYNGLNTHSE